MNWNSFVFEIPNTINTNNFNVVVTTADWASGVDHLVEAGIDDFYIDNDPISSISNIDSYDIRVFPNPTEDGYVYISGLSSSFRYSLFNLSGQLISHGANNSIF